MKKLTRRQIDLQNLKVLCDFRIGDITETQAYSRIVFTSTTLASQNRYLKKLITIIHDEEKRQLNTVPLSKLSNITKD